jgi:hypothetical protein
VNRPVEPPKDAKLAPTLDPAAKTPNPANYPSHELDAAARDMQAMLDTWPSLTPAGFYVEEPPILIPRSVEWLGPANAAISEDSETFAFWQSRMAMRTEDALAASIRSRTWLKANVVKLKSLNKREHSESLRNIAARDIGEISHGVFIAALDLEYFKVVQAKDNLGRPMAHAYTDAALRAGYWRRALASQHLSKDQGKSMSGASKKPPDAPRRELQGGGAGRGEEGDDPMLRACEEADARRNEPPRARGPWLRGKKWREWKEARRR